MDITGLLYYHARMYDPALGRFVSADSVVPGNASGSMEGLALKELTVDFHELAFVVELNQENQQPFWFQMSEKQRQKAGIPWGPVDPQALNRYSYVQNNPLRYTDPTGHLGVSANQYTGTVTFHLSHEDVDAIWSIAFSSFLTLSEKGLRLGQFLLQKVGPALAKLLGAALGALSGFSDAAFMVGGALKLADMYYGDQGVDITVQSGQTPVVSAPTVDRQEGLWVKMYNDAPDGRSLTECAFADDCDPQSRFVWRHMCESLNSDCFFNEYYVPPYINEEKNLK